MPIDRSTKRTLDNHENRIDNIEDAIIKISATADEVKKLAEEVWGNGKPGHGEQIRANRKDIQEILKLRTWLIFTIGALMLSFLWDLLTHNAVFP